MLTSILLAKQAKNFQKHWHRQSDHFHSLLHTQGWIEIAFPSLVPNLEHSGPGLLMGVRIGEIGGEGNG